MKRIGVDVGGTFTDLILVDEEAGTVTVDKVPSTPDDPARGVVEGIARLCAKGGVALADVDNLLHGTTVATNIALTHTGAEVGMITTEGFRDILHIARHKKPFNFSLMQELPWQSRPLVKRRHLADGKERDGAGRRCSCRSTRTRCASGSASSAPRASRRSRCACSTRT
ncbi:MAG: hydantoinase/oxoprolinase N-terminal domain-containing protein [Thermoleophilia bacterium]